MAKEQEIYLIDYEFIDQHRTGLDLIEEHGIQMQSILVTSRFEDQAIRDRCVKLGIRMIPKGLAAYVPVKVSQSCPNL